MDFNEISYTAVTALS